MYYLKPEKNDRKNLNQIRMNEFESLSFFFVNKENKYSDSEGRSYIFDLCCLVVYVFQYK